MFVADQVNFLTFAGEGRCHLGSCGRSTRDVFRFQGLDCLGGKSAVTMGRDYPEQSGKAYYRGQQWDEERTHTTTLAGNYADHGRHGVYFDDGRQAAYAENGRYPGYPDDGRSNAYDDNGRHAWYADNGRYQHLTGSMPIDMALREHCRIPVKRYFLAVQTDDGKMLYMHSQHKLDERDVFNRMGFDALVPERDPRRRNFGMSRPFYSRHHGNAILIFKTCLSKLRTAADNDSWNYLQRHMNTMHTERWDTEAHMQGWATHTTDLMQMLGKRADTLVDHSKLESAIVPKPTSVAAQTRQLETAT